MKNKTIIKILCIALAMIFIGGAITAFAAISGGELSIAQSRHGIFSFIKWSDNHDKHYDNTSFQAENSFEKFSATINYGSIEIRHGSTLSITTEGIDKNDISISEANNEFSITVEQNDIQIIGNNHAGTIYVTLPDSVKDITINQSLGEVEMEHLNLQSLNIDSSMGNVDLENVVFENGDITLKMGELDFYGDFTSQFTIVNNMGDVDLQLMKYETEYNYDLKVSVGDLHVNDHQHGSLNATYEQNNQKACSLKARLDMGNLEIEYGHD